MEEAGNNEQKKETNLPSPVKLPQNSTDSNNKNEEIINDEEVDRPVTTPVALEEGSESQQTVNNSVSNSNDNGSVVNQSAEAIGVTVNYDEKNQETIDQEKEKCEPMDDGDDKGVTPTVTSAIPDSSGVPGSTDSNGSVEQIQETDKTSDVNLVEEEHKDDKESSSKSDDSAKVGIGVQPEKKEESKEVPKEKDVDKSEVVSEETTKAATTETHPSEPLAESPEGEIEKTEVLSGETKEVVTTEIQVDKESLEGKNSENTTDTSSKKEESPVDHPEMQKKEEGLSAETSEVAETKPEMTGDEKVSSEVKQPENKDKESPSAPTEGPQPSSTWYTGDEAENPNQEAEGYSTSVVGGVVLRTPLPSNSSEPKKPAKATSTGSVFKKMSWGSIFGKKKTTKDKPAAQAVAVEETPVPDGTDGVQESQPDKKESAAPVDVVQETKEVSQEAVGPSEPVAEKEQENDPEVQAEEEEKKDISEGAIVPLEEGVTEKDEETTEATDVIPQQDEQKDDIETPADEDSLLRERIAKRETTSPSHSSAKHMQMRMSYAEGSKEVEVIGTREVSPQAKPVKQKSSKDATYRLSSCRELGEVDHEGWLSKRGGGAIFASWKRKWVVLKEQKVYYYKTSFDPEAGGVVPVENHIITAAPEMKRKFCFKIESQDPKANKFYFTADSQEDMDKWMSVLTSASRGESIPHKTENQQTDDTKVRKKSNSFGKRAGSVLGLGGYYEYDGELEKKDQKRRASFGSSPKENQKNTNTVEIKDRSASPTEEATPSDIQKLMTVQTNDDDVDGPVAMETSSAAPTKEECGQPAATPTVAMETSSAAPSKEESGQPAVTPTVAMETSSTALLKEESSQNVESEIKPSSEKQEECQPEVSTSEETMETPKVNQSETTESAAEQKDARVATPSKQPPKPSQQDWPTNTTWYFVVDPSNNDWVELDPNKGDTDELLSLVRSIKDARVSIIGTPLPGNEERARALTHVSQQNSEILKLREMKRTLKDKERDLMAMEELFSKDINRQSIHEWKTRYSYLTPEGDNIEENGNVDEKSDSSDENGKVEDGDVKSGEVEDKNLKTEGDVKEVKSEDSGSVENGKQEDDKEVTENGEDVQASGEPQDGKPEDGEEAQGGDQPEDSGAVQFDSKEEDRDLPENAKDASLDKEEVPEKTEEVADESISQQKPEGEAVETVEEPSREILPSEENNNAEISKDSKEEQTEVSTQDKEAPKKDEEKDDAKSITTTDTLPLQDPDSIDTRL